MKKDKTFFSNIIMITFITCYITVNFLAYRKVEINGLTACASVFIYPITYMIAILFRERYGKAKAAKMILFAGFALLLSSVLINFASLYPVYGGQPDGLEIIFSMNYRIVLASIAAFFISQSVCLLIYDYLDYKKPLKFLFAAVIATTLDSLVFVILAYTGISGFREIILTFTGQYVYNVIAVVIYALLFEYFIEQVEKCKLLERNEELKEQELESIHINELVAKEIKKIEKEKKVATKKVTVKPKAKTTKTKSTKTKKSE